VRKYLLGIDGGGTKTAAVLVDAEMTEIAHVISGPSNYHTVGQASAETSLREAIHQLLDAAGLTADDVAAAGLGLAGVDAREAHKRLAVADL
jgi:N-acetylglucosamine kinase-like BadF-type ATPase